MGEPVPFHELRTAAFCPRKLYYRRRKGDKEPPATVREIKHLAFEYDRLLDADDETLLEAPIEVSPGTFRENLTAARRRLDSWEHLEDPNQQNVFLEGKDCRGIVHKVLPDPPRPSVVSAGAPPDRGVWKPQSVHAVAAAKALAWEREQPVEAALVEYPAYGVVRTIGLSVRRRADYRASLRIVRTMDGPPARLHDSSRCSSCEYRTDCGVKTRTLASLLRG